MRFITYFQFFLISFLFPVVVLAAPQVSLFLDNNVFEINTSTPKIYVAATNDLANQYDVHIGVISPNGTIYEYPNWNTTLDPWLKKFSLPLNFKFPTTEITNLDSFTSDLTPGIWRAAIALTEPNTLNIIAYNEKSFLIDDPITSNGAKFVNFLMSDQHLAANLSSYSTSLDLIPHIKTQWGSTTPTINQCVFYRQFSLIELNLQPLDVGNVNLFGGNQSLSLTKRQASDLMYTSKLTENFYQAGANYVLQGTGGSELSAFSVSSTSVPRLELISPTVAETVIDSNSDLNLVWNGNNDIGLVTASIVGVVFDSESFTSELYVISCRFSNDGNGAIPSNLLKQFKDKDIPEVSMSVNHKIITLFNTKENNLDMGVFVIQSGVQRNKLIIQ